MLNLKFPVTMSTGVVSKLSKITIMLFFPSILKTDFKVLQLLNGLRKSKRLFSVGCTLPYNRPEAIFSLLHVQNVLGDEEGGCRCTFLIGATPKK
jgi:hypothetical protein